MEIAKFKLGDLVYNRGAKKWKEDWKGIIMNRRFLSYHDQIKLHGSGNYQIYEFGWNYQIHPLSEGWKKSLENLYKSGWEFEKYIKKVVDEK